MFYIVFCILIITAVPFRFVSFSNQDSSGIYPYQVEDQIVIVAVTCGWMYFLFFARFFFCFVFSNLLILKVCFLILRVFETTGPFVVMIYKMVIGDIMTFGAIYLFLLFGFSLGNFFLDSLIKIFLKPLTISIYKKKHFTICTEMRDLAGQIKHSKTMERQ